MLSIEERYNVHSRLKTGDLRKKKFQEKRRSHVHMSQTGRWMIESYKRKSLAGQRAEYAVSLDECRFRVDCYNGKCIICYAKDARSVKTETWICKTKESFQGEYIYDLLSGAN